MNKHIVTYQMYGDMLDQLVWKIESSKMYTKVKNVYAPPRGGLPIAVHLSHHLGLKFIPPGMLLNQSTNGLSQTLIVDDIADTGKTFITIKKMYDAIGSDLITATLFLKDRSEFIPYFWVEKNNDWVVFPFERLDEIPNREGYE